MTENAPEKLLAALADGTWRDPGSARLREIFSAVPDVVPMQLFPDRETMLHVGDAARRYFLDEPQFCLVRACDRAHDDPRLSIDDALFIGGSISPGDDVLIALDLSVDRDDPPVLIFDWSREEPLRWVTAGRLSTLLRDMGTDLGP